MPTTENTVNGQATPIAHTTPYRPDGTEIDANGYTPDEQRERNERREGDAAEAHSLLRKINFRKTTRRRVRRSALALAWIAAITVVIVYFGFPQIDHAKEADQSAAIADLQRQVATLQTQPFPMGAAQSVAMPVVIKCTAYTGQAPQETLKDLKDTCGWEGQGVANLAPSTGLYPDTNPALAYISGDYAAVPFRVRMLNSNVPMEPQLYYVLVHKDSNGAVSPIGSGAYFMTPPTFITTGGHHASTSATPDSTNPLIQSVVQFLAGEARYTVPGVTLPMSNGSLKATASRNFVVYSGTDTSTIVTFEVQWTGPTANSTYWQQISAELAQNSDHEWRIKALGLDASQGK